MDFILDASCAINLVNGDVFEIIVDLENASVLLGPIVLSECISVKSSISSALCSGKIKLLDDNAVETTTYLSILRKYNLGPGEVECIAFGKVRSGKVCMDDKLARSAAIREIGQERVSGSLGLLRHTVGLGRLNVDTAFDAYSRMIARGGFLPNLSENQFAAYLLTDLSLDNNAREIRAQGSSIEY